MSGTGKQARLRWEFAELPIRLRADPRTLVWAPFGPPLNLAVAKQTVWMCHNLIPLLPASEREISAADKPRIRVLRALFWYWARHARQTICVSRHARERLSRLARVDIDSIDVIPHGVDQIPATLRCSTEELEALRTSRFVFHAGQAIPYRRTRELFAAYALLARRHDSIPPLLIAGEARGEDQAYQAACLAELQPLVSRGLARFLGQISHSDVLALMNSAHAFVYPSVHEDCPCVVLEALSAGRVGVYADIPATRELAGDAGIFVPNPQPENLAEAMASALFDDSLRARLGAAARARSDTFTWDRTAERVAAALQRAGSLA